MVWLYSRLAREDATTRTTTLFPRGATLLFRYNDDDLEEEAQKPSIEWNKKKSQQQQLQLSILKETGKNVVFPRTTGTNEKKKNICQEPMRIIFQRQYCLLQASRGELAECMQLLLPGTPEKEEDGGIAQSWNASSVVLVPGPVHQLSYMWGQGFGRIITQGVRTCTLAALLNRPCSIDLLRDKYYNFRAFLQPGALNWEMASRVVMAQNNVNISDALHKMPQGIEQGHGWESLVVGDNKDDKDATKTTTNARNQQEEGGGVPEYDNVLPMVWGRDKKTINDDTIGRHLHEWDGQNARHGHKVLLSPNFGDAWHGCGQDCARLGGQWNQRHAPCTNNHMKTFLQNEMFVPTSLAYELHLERRAIVLQEKELEQQPAKSNADDKKRKRRPKDADNNKEVLTTNSGLSARTTLPPHGAMHLRMNILNQDMCKMDVSQEQAPEGLKACFQSFAKDEAFRDLRWWLISDNVEVADFISRELENVYSYAASSAVPAADDNRTTPTEKKTLFKGIHSGDAMGKKFGQGAIAPSMIDWMALHESHISLVTYETAYGETGARGNGKIQEGNCGGKVEGKKISFPCFSFANKLTSQSNPGSLGTEKDLITLEQNAC